MLRRILVSLDRSTLAECVLPHAVALATALGASVTLLHVMILEPSGDRVAAADPLAWRIRRAEAETYLQSIQAQLEAAGVAVESEVVDGQAAEQIISFAHDHDVSLILMSSHGQSGLSGWNVSSVVQKVLLRARTSIMVVRAYAPTRLELTGLRYQRLLAPLDGSQRAETVLPLVADLARAHKSHVLLVHVVERLDMPRRTPLATEDAELIDKLVERNQRASLLYLEEVCKRLDDLDVESRVIVATQSGAAVALHQLAEAENADLLVLSAHCYSEETAWPYGAVVISSLAYGASPLLILQDMPPDQILPTAAELALQQGGRR